MALKNIDPHNLPSAKAAEDLQEKQYCLAKYNTAGEAELCGAGGAGYSIDEPAEEGSYVTLVVGAERAAMKLGGSVAIGDSLESNSEGLAVKASNGLIVGVAREAGVAGDVIEVLTCPPVTTA